MIFLTESEKKALKGIRESITDLHEQIMKRVSPQDETASDPFSTGRILLFNILDAWGDGTVEPALEMVLYHRPGVRESIQKYLATI